MNNTKTTKRALLTSVVAIFMCVTMLIGTTFAWFTDTASTGVNKIQAGNLDVEVEYSKNGTSWANLEGTRSLFSGDLWEPGHTEVVYLRVKNAGTLGLNYKVLVTPVSENGGVNVYGESFKLSDYLVFGTTEPKTTLTTYTRDTARDAVGTATGLTDVNNLTKTGTMVGKDASDYSDQYLALVVYMPESVGNKANYKTGTAAPTIELGIKVVATQLTDESDSFDNQYDKDAVDEPFYAGGAYYDYFEAVNVSGNAGADGNFTVTKNDAHSGIIASASGTADAGAQVNLLVMKSSEAEKNFTITVEDGHELNGYEIKVTGQTEGSLVQGKLYVGTGLENFKFYHNNAEMNVGTKDSLTDGQYYYDSTDGFVYFASTTFSPFQATYKAPVAAIGTAVYGTLADAIAAAKDGETVVMLKDETVEGCITVNGGKNVVLNLNGHEVVSNDNYLFDVYNANFRITGLGSVFENVKDGYAPIRARGSNTSYYPNYPNYTVITIDKGVTLKGDYAGIFVGKDAGEEYNNFGLVVNMYGTIDMSAVEDGYHYCGIYVNGQNTMDFYNTVMQFNLDGATIKGCEGQGIYAAGYAKWNLTNCDITAVGAAMEIRAGELTINGGNYTATAATAGSDSNGNGSTTYGAAIAVAQHATKKTIKVNITAGTFNGVNALAEANTENNSAADLAKITMSVTGGTFNGAIVSEDLTGFITGGKFSTDPGAYVPMGYEVVKNGDWYELNDHIITPETIANVDFTEANKTFYLQGNFNGITINKFGENSVLCFLKNTYVSGDLKLYDDVTIKGEGKNRQIFVSGNLTVEASKPVTVNIENANLWVRNNISVGYTEGKATLNIKNSTVRADNTLFVGAHVMNHPNAKAELNITDSFVFVLKEGGTGSVISVWGKSGVDATIINSEIRTSSSGWHLSEDANDNSLTFQGGDHINVTFESSNFFLRGARSIIKANRYYDNDATIDFKINNCFIGVVTKSSHNAETLPVWGATEITNSILQFARYVDNQAANNCWVYGNPTISGNCSLSAFNPWSNLNAEILLENQTVTLAESANITVGWSQYMSFVLSEGGRLVVENGAKTDIPIKAADGYTLNTTTENGVTTYTVTAAG